MSSSRVDAKHLFDYISAGYSGFWIRTSEAVRAEQVIRDILKEKVWSDGARLNVQAWDCASMTPPNPKLPLDELSTTSEEKTVVILYNYHWFIEQPLIIQQIQNSMEKWRNKCKAIIILSPKSRIPPEIEKDFLVMELPLPDIEEIEKCMEHLALSSENSGGPKKADLLNVDRKEIANAAKGLTSTEIENVMSLSIVTKRKFDVEVIHEQKIQVIEKSGLIDVLRPVKTYNDIIGFDKMKFVVGKMIAKPTSRGILIVGPPGCGKTAFMHCTAGEFKRLALMINFGRLFSKYQGVGFEQVEEVIAIIEAIGHCIVIMDETLSMLNPSNCWKPLRAKFATTQLETAIVTAQKEFGLGNQQLRPCFTIGQSSTTIPYGSSL